MWNNEVSHDEMCRRASGRRQYNAVRQFRAELRRREIIDLTIRRGLVPFTHGMQSRLAEHFGVSRSTICRDLARIREDNYRAGCCPTCGSYMRDRVWK